MHEPNRVDNLWIRAPRPGVILQRGPACSYPIFAHSEYHFGLVTEGGLITRRGGGEYLARSGSLTALHPAEAHSGRSMTDAGWSYQLVVVDQSIVQAAVDAVGASGDLYFPRLVISDDVIAKEFQQAHLILADPTSDLEFDEVLGSIVNAFVAWTEVRSVQKRGSDDRAARRAMDLLHAHYADNLSLDSLANAVDGDKYRVAKAFKRLTALPPHAFQTRLRISAARRLLASEMSLVEIALECGFSSQAHLNRHFGRLLGISPGLYLRTLCESRSE